MIISASRRTDIPAFFGEWLMRRLREGFVLVRNPMNFHQVSRVPLNPAQVECIVFWTKNPEPMLAELAEIEALGYGYYFLFTLTPYDGSIEPHVPDIKQRIATLQTLSKQIGREKVIWRYDPILFTNRYTTAFHAASFAEICGKLAGFTDRCIVSFVEMYRKCERNMKGLALLEPSLEERTDLLRTLQAIATTHGIILQSCAIAADLHAAAVVPGKCIDDHLVARIRNNPIYAGKDKNQRRECNCVESIDIGAYNSCPHNCLYCYANSDRYSVTKNFATHRTDSPLLYGDLLSTDRISERVLKSLSLKQQKLF